MARLVDGIVAGGLLAGTIWYARREIRKARAATRAGERLVAVVEARAGGMPPMPVRVPPARSAAPRAASATTSAAGGLSRRFDELFQQCGQGLPIAYLRALANAESGLNPDDPRGLINVVTVGLADYNRRHPGASVAASRLRDPAVSVTVAADILRTIIASYRRFHPDVLNLAEDWNNPRFVELLTQGWNAGFSEAGGVGRVVRHLQAQPAASLPTSITVDTIAANAAAAGATKHLTNPRKLAFAKRVAADFAREQQRDREAARPSS